MSKRKKMILWDLNRFYGINPFGRQSFPGHWHRDLRPSSLVMALTTSVGKYNGFDSALFAISLIFSFVVMYDAAGIRRAAGKQAEIINYMIEHHKLPELQKVKELLGHTPLEVFVGAILGIVVGLLF